MASAVSRIKFAIEFQGSAQCWKDANVCAIDLIGPKSKVFAESVKPRDSRLQAGRLKWCIPNKDAIRFLMQTTKLVDQIALTPEVARTIQLSARVFELVDANTWTKGPDGIVRRDQVARRHVIPITIEDPPELEEGASYLITVRNMGNLRATITRVGEQMPKAPQEAAAEEKEDEDFASRVLEDLIRAYTANNSALDTLPASELHQRFQQKIAELEEAKRCNSTAQRAIAEEMFQLSGALIRKGELPPPYNDFLESL